MHKYKATNHRLQPVLFKSDQVDLSSDQAAAVPAPPPRSVIDDMSGVEKMIACQRAISIVQCCGLELLLALAIITLAGQLSWPAAWDWWRRPTPGSIGIDRIDLHSALATECLVYLPESDDGPWPLIVFLHGSGQRGDDPTVLRNSGPFRYLKQASLPAIVAAPQCLPMQQWESHTVMQFVDRLAEQYQVDRQRIYLVGYSMGGYGTWRTAADYPTRFAAIAPICGGGQPDDAEAFVGLPVWAFHGAKDKVVPVTGSERTIAAIRAAGGSPKLTVFQEGGHGICDAVCQGADLWNWLLRQKASGGRTPVGNETPP